MDFTEKEKRILIMCFRMVNTILNSYEPLENNYGYFDKNDLFNLAEKLEIEDY